MKTYTIYEIPGVKIGCTDNIVRRQKKLLSKGELIILESHTCIDKASEREKELQRSYGYPVEKTSYKFIVQVLNPKSNSPEAIKKMIANTDYKTKAANTNRNEKVDYVAASISLQKPIVAIDSKGVRTSFNSIAEASRKLTLITGTKYHKPGITFVLRPKYKQQIYKGYRFEYIDK